MNRLYLGEPALWEAEFHESNFYWVDCLDHEASVVSFVRQNVEASRQVLAVVNLALEPREGYRIGLPRDGWWCESLNSDAGIYGGTNFGNEGGAEAELIPWHHQPFSAQLQLPPLGCLVFQRS